MLLKSLLEANDIPTYVPEELTTQSAVNYAGSGLRVQVDDENAEAAKRILADVEHSADAENAQDLPEQGSDQPR